MSLNGLIIGAFRRLTKNTSAVFPSPETFRGLKDIIDEFLQDGFDFWQRRVIIQIRVVIFGLDLEQGRLFTCGLLNEVLKSQEGPQNHLY